jgi:hypothetical protein
MLIDKTKIFAELQKRSVKITGALHLGAHDCEELGFYNELGLTNDLIVWVDAIPYKVGQATARGIPNVFNAIITDKDDEEVQFNVSNNIQSSSVLELKTHAIEHPEVKYVVKFASTSVTIDTFCKRIQVDASKLNFWNFDIQGAELMALKGGTSGIQFVDAIYLEVNQTELYSGCGLIGEIDDFLRVYGFERVLTEMTKHGWGDALYLRK